MNGADDEPTDPMDPAESSGPHGTACARCGEVHDQRRCPAHSKRTGEQCKRRAGHGTDHPGHGLCQSHGGKSPNGRKHAERVMTETRIRELLAEYQPDVEHVDPHSDLLEVVALTSGMRRVLTQLVGELAPFGTRAYIEGRDDDDAGQAVYVPQEPAGVYGPDHLGDGKPHVLVEMLRQWTVENAKAAKLAIDAGIDERRIRIVEEQAEQLVVVMRAALAALVDRARELSGDEGLARELTAFLPAAIRRAIEASGVIDTTAVEARGRRR